jgi:hypothetical protein
MLTERSLDLLRGQSRSCNFVVTHGISDMTSTLGILAFGSLIDCPDWEIKEAVVDRKSGIWTPFSVEFARASRTRAGAPTLVPVDSGGGKVLAHILVVDLPEQEAKKPTLAPRN